MKLKPQYRTLLGLKDLRPKIKSNPTYTEKYIENIQGRVLLLDDWNKTPATWFDHSGSGNNGTVYGAGTPPAATPGALGYTFDGVDDYVDCGNAASLNITDAITIEAWIKTSQSPATDKIILSKSGTGSIQWGLRFASNVEGYVTKFSVYDTNWTQAVGTTAINNNVFHHIVGVKNATHILIFVDGVFQASSLLSSLPITSGNLEVGQRVAANFFNGTIDEVRIWNRALNATEIWSHYIKYKGKFGL